MDEQKGILILSINQIVHSHTAGEARIKTYIKSILLNEEVNFVLLISKNKLYKVFDDYKLSLICSNCLIKTIRNINKETEILVYPSSNSFNEILILLFFKFIKRRKIFLELNEVRKFSVTLQSNLSNVRKYPYKYFKALIKRFFYHIHDLLIPLYDGVITISENITKYYSKKNVNILQVPILSDLSYPPCVPHPFDPQSSSFIIVFTGTVNIVKENFFDLFKAMRYLKNLNLELHLYGSMDKDNTVIFDELIEKLEISQMVFYHGKKPSACMRQIYETAHLLILPRGNTKQNKYGFSTKLADYLVSGKPVLVTDVSDNCKYIKNCFNGFIVQPDSWSEMVKKIEFIYYHYNKYYIKIHKNALQTVKKYFDYHLYSRDLFLFLSSN